MLSHSISSLFFVLSKVLCFACFSLFNLQGTSALRSFLSAATFDNISQGPAFVKHFLSSFLMIFQGLQQSCFYPMPPAGFSPSPEREE